jgi:hypothetical protein
MTTIEISATEDETLVDLPPGDVELKTPHPVVFWCASPDPSVRAKDYRTELQRLHAGTPITIGSVPPGWKLAISLRPDLPALYRERPRKEPEPAPPGPTAEELAERALARQIAKDIERADMVNEAYDLVMSRLPATAAPAPEPSPPLLPAPDALMSDWGEVGAYPGVPDDFVQLMTGDETLEQAVERMTLGVDELLDMATVLSDQSLEMALCTVPPERVNEWTEKLITEKARLRRLRGTVDENFGRENLVSRVQGMFAQVGAKR